MQATLGEAAFKVVLDEGRAMSFEQATEYALGQPTTPHKDEEEDAHPPAPEADVLLSVFALGPARVESLRAGEEG